MVSNHGAAFVAAGPVVAGLICIVRPEGSAVILGSGKDVMCARRFATSVNQAAVLVQCGEFGNRSIVKMQVRNISRDQDTRVRFQCDLWR